MKFILPFLYLLVIYEASAQSDSLHQRLDIASTLEQKNDARLSLAYYFENRDLDSMRYYAFAVFRTLDTSKYTPVLYRTLHAVEMTYLRSSQLDTAAMFNAQSMHVAKNLNNPGFIIETLINKGNIEWMRGDFAKSERTLNRADSIQSVEGDYHLNARLLNNRALLNWQWGKLDKSLGFAYKAIRNAEKEGDKFEESRAYNCAGLIYNEKSDFPNAIEVFKKSVEINKNQGFLRMLGINYNNIALNYQWQKKYNKALEYYQLAGELAEQVRNKTDIARNYHNRGDIYAHLGQYNKALELKFKALEMQRELGLNRNMAISLNTIGQIYIDLGQYDNALRYSEEAKNLSIKIDNKRQIYHAYEQIAQIQKLTGHPDRGFESLEKAYAYRDSMLNEQSNDRIAHYKELYETEKKEKQLSEKEKLLEQEKKNAELMRSRFVSGASVFIMLIGGVFFFVFRKKEKEKREMQKSFARGLIESQEKERIRISKELHDGVGQNLLLIKRSLAGNRNETSGMVDKTIDEIRIISRKLHPFQLDKFGISRALESMIDELNSLVPEIFFSEEIENIDGLFSKENELNLYRIIQECMNNIIKHSEASAAKLTVQKAPQKVLVSIVDNGKGFDVDQAFNKSKSLGLKSLKERVEFMNGRLHIDSSPGKNTTINIKINL